jgi:hypothetical protein
MLVRESALARVRAPGVVPLVFDAVATLQFVGLLGSFQLESRVESESTDSMRGACFVKGPPQNQCSIRRHLGSDESWQHTAGAARTTSTVTLFTACIKEKKSCRHAHSTETRDHGLHIVFELMLCMHGSLMDSLRPKAGSAIFLQTVCSLVCLLLSLSSVGTAAGSDGIAQQDVVPACDSKAPLCWLSDASTQTFMARAESAGIRCAPRLCVIWNVLLHPCAQDKL